MTNLQKIRINKGYSQSQLSRISGVSPRTIQNYESNHRLIDNANVVILYRLARTLDCRVSDLLSDDIKSMVQDLL